MQLQIDKRGPGRRQDHPRDLTELIVSPARWDIDAELGQLEAQWKSELRESRKQREVEALMRGEKLPSAPEEEDAAREKQMRDALRKAFGSMLPPSNSASFPDLRQHNQELWIRIEQVGGAYNRHDYLHRPDGGGNSTMMDYGRRVYVLALFKELLSFLSGHSGLDLKSLGTAEVMRDYVCHNLDKARLDSHDLKGGRHAAVCGEIFAIGGRLAEKLQGQVEFLDWQMRRLKMD